MRVIGIAVVALLCANGIALGQDCAAQTDTDITITMQPSGSSIHQATFEIEVTNVTADPSPINLELAGLGKQEMPPDGSTVDFYDSGEFRADLTVSVNDTTRVYTLNVYTPTGLNFNTETWTMTFSLPAGVHRTNSTLVSTEDSGGAANISVQPCNEPPTFTSLTAEPALNAVTDLVNEQATVFAIMNDATFTVTGAADPDSASDVASYGWVLNHEVPAMEPDEATAATTQPNHNETIDPAVQEITMEASVVDVEGGTSLPKTLTNTRPNTHSITAEATDPPVATRLQFTAVAPANGPNPEDGADPEDDLIDYYHWNFGDDGDATTVDEVITTDNPYEHSYGNDGSYTVTLRVQDARGLWSEDAMLDNVDPDFPPEVDPDNPAPPSGLRIDVDGRKEIWGEAPFLYTLSGTVTDDTTEDYYWEWDIEGEAPTSEADPTITLTDPGVRNASVKVTGVDTGFESAETAFRIGAYPNERANFPHAGGLPYDPNKAPIVDGILTGYDSVSERNDDDPYGENGWRGAFRIPFGDGTDPTVRVDLIRRGGKLYVGIEAAFDTDLTNDDVIFIGIGKDTDARYSAGGVADVNDATLALLKLTPLAATEAARLVIYMRDGTGAWSPLGQAEEPAGIDFGFRNETAVDLDAVPPVETDGDRWSAELKLPVVPSDSAGPEWLKLASEFLLFVQVFKTEAEPTTATWYTWPRAAAPHTPIIDPAAPTVDPIWWGVAHREDDYPSGGIAIASRNHVGVSTESPPIPTTLLTSSIDSTEGVANTLVAKVSNDAHRLIIDETDTDGDGDVTERIPKMLDAANVEVRFRLAKWGATPDPGEAPDYWTLVDVDPEETHADRQNPVGPKDVPKGQQVTYDNTPVPNVEIFSTEWGLSPAQRDLYAGTHQCMLVEVDVFGNDEANPQNEVNIRTRSVYRNMDFTPVNDVDAFERASQIVAPLSLHTESGGRGDILLRVYTREWTLEPDDKRRLALAHAFAAQGPSGQTIIYKRPPPALIAGAAPHLVEIWPYIEEATAPVHFIEFIVKAFAYTGRTVTSNGVRHDEVVPSGSYGYVVRHKGEIEAWDFHILGAEKTGEHAYLVQLSPGDAAEVTDHVNALIPPRWAVTAAAGLAIPELVNVSGYKIGPNATVEGAFLLDSQYSLNAQLGYAYMPPSDTTTDPWHEGRLSLFFQSSFDLLPWLRPFLTVGGGVFVNSTGGLSGGAVVATGIGFRLGRAMDLRFGVDFIGNSNHGNVHTAGGTVVRLVEPKLQP